MRKFLLLAVVATVAGLTPMASAQYMYLDANGNGVHDAGDQMAVNGTPTNVDVYLDSAHNRDGSDATCNSGSEALDYLSYLFWLQAINGTVTYSGFVNQQPSWATTFPPEINTDTLYRNGFGGSVSTIVAAGLHKLASIVITGASGSPHVIIVDNVPGSGDDANLTSFGTPCFGNDFDNTYKLVGATGLGTDWHDTDGLGAADGTATNETTWGKIKELYR